MNAASKLLALATAAGLAACNAPAEPAARTGLAGQATSTTRATPAPYVNPPETSSGY